MPAWIGRFLRRFVRYFVAGTFVLLPVVITVAVIAWVAGLLHSFIGPDTVVGSMVQRLGLSVMPNSPSAYLAGTFVVLVVIFVIGFIAESGARALMQKTIDAGVQKIPLIGNLYGTSRQFVAMIDRRKDDDATKSMTAVFCRFGDEHGTGILGLLVSPQRFVVDDREYVIVVVPTAPVPVGGGLFFMPADSVREAGISVESLMSIYVSMGITAPQFMKVKT